MGAGRRSCRFHHRIGGEVDRTVGGHANAFRADDQDVEPCGVTPTLARHLAANHGLLARREHRDAGLSVRQIERLVARGDLVPVHRGVYRHAAAQRTPEQAIHAGLLAVGRDAVLSHRTALDRHGVRGFRCSLVELTARSTSLPLRDGLVVHRSPNLSNADIMRRHGWWITTPERSLVDAATVVEPTLVARYAHRWAAERLIRLDRLDETIDRAGNHRGATRLARILAAASGPVADSIPEGDLGHLLARWGIPAEHHVVVTTARGDTFEIDWSYPDVRLGLEVDGYGVHLRSEQAFDDDRLRRNELEIEGWQILNVSARQLRRAPRRFVEQVTRALAVRQDVASS